MMLTRAVARIFSWGGAQTLSWYTEANEASPKKGYIRARLEGKRWNSGCVPIGATFQNKEEKKQKLMFITRTIYELDLHVCRLQSIKLQFFCMFTAIIHVTSNSLCQMMDRNADRLGLRCPMGNTGRGKIIGSWWWNKTKTENWKTFYLQMKC